jgi:hypothetical protein
VPVEETSEDIEEAQLDEARDLKAEEDAPTEPLVDHEDEMMVLSSRILLDKVTTSLTCPPRYIK